MSFQLNVMMVKQNIMALQLNVMAFRLNVIISLPHQSQASAQRPFHVPKPSSVLTKDAPIPEIWPTAETDQRAMQVKADAILGQREFRFR